MLKFLAILLLAMAIPMEAQAAEQQADNAEMSAMFDSDQKIRSELTPESMKDQDFLLRFVMEDRERLARTTELLNQGALATANDYYHAAFIFQHGNTGNSYLLAHSLAIVAVAEGHEKAAWIAAATLDRYLHEIGQEQIYGTQFENKPGEPTTQGAFDRTLIPDTLREALGVPNLEAQERRAAEISARRGIGGAVSN